MAASFVPAHNDLNFIDQFLVPAAIVEADHDHLEMSLHYILQGCLICSEHPDQGAWQLKYWELLNHAQSIAAHLENTDLIQACQSLMAQLEAEAI